MKHKLSHRLINLALLCLMVVLQTARGQSQSVSSAKLKPYVGLWEEQDLEGLFKALPEIQKKYAKSPEALFFSGLFNPDATQARLAYEKIVADFPENYFAGISLFKLFQYAYARGEYLRARGYLNKLDLKYPQSSYLVEGKFLLQKSLLSDNKKSVDTTAHKSTIPQLTAYYSVQLGAFSDRANAEKLKVRIESLGYAEVHIVEKTANAALLYAVWAGKFQQKETAKELAAQLKNKHQFEFSIVYKKN